MTIKIETNHAVVLSAPGKMDLQEWPVPELGPLDVLINVKVTGICGSDMYFFSHMRHADMVMKEPLVLGHEAAGMVVAVGKRVDRVQIGDKVAVEPGVTCRYCDMCKEGKYNLCPNVHFYGTPGYHGTLCNYFKLPQDFCFKLPEHVSLEEGALVEPLSVGLYSVQRGNVQPGDTVFVLGAGAIGLLTSAAAKAAGATRITIFDVVQSRLDFASKTYGVNTVLLDRPQAGEPNMEYSKRTAKHILADRNGWGADVVLDCTGVETCVQLSVLLCKNGGSAVLVGMGGTAMTFPAFEMAARQVDVKGVFRYCNTYRRAIELIDRKLIDVKPLITDTFPLKDAGKAFAHVKEGHGSTIKVQIVN